MTVEQSSTEKLKLKYQELKQAIEQNEASINKLLFKDQEEMYTLQKLLKEKHELNERIKTLNENLWYSCQDINSCKSSEVNWESETGDVFLKYEADEEIEEDPDDLKCEFEYADSESNTDDSCNEALSSDEKILKWGIKCHDICDNLTMLATSSATEDNEELNFQSTNEDDLIANFKNDPLYNVYEYDELDEQSSINSFSNNDKEISNATCKTDVADTATNPDFLAIGDPGLHDAGKESIKEYEEKTLNDDYECDYRHFNCGNAVSVYSNEDETNCILSTYGELETRIDYSEEQVDTQNFFVLQEKRGSTCSVNENSNESLVGYESTRPDLYEDELYNLSNEDDFIHSSKTESDDVAHNIQLEGVEFKADLVDDILKTSVIEENKVNEMNRKPKSFLKKCFHFLLMVMIISSLIFLFNNSRIYSESVTLVKGLIHYLFHWNEEWYFRKWGMAKIIKPKISSSHSFTVFDFLQSFKAKIEKTFRVN